MISVIVPIYNTEKYLRQCLDSLVNQTLKELEIICINDGSTDNSAKILCEYNNILVITQTNQGLSAARNAGINVARGEYIAFIDSDDWVDLDFFEKLYNAIYSTNADIAVASILRGGNKYRVKYDKQEISSELDEKIKICNYPENSYVWNKLYRAELVKSVKFEEGIFYEDVFWTPQILQLSKKLVTVPDTKYHYRRHAGSIVKKLPSIKKQEDFYNAKKYALEFFDKNQIQISEKARYITSRKYYLWKMLLCKIKKYRYNTIYYLFGFIPTITITKYPQLLGEKND